MSLGLLPAQMKQLKDMSRAGQRKLIAGLTPADLLRLDADFEMWAQEGQRPPSGKGWRVWLMMAGRGFGKTRAGSEWVHGVAIGKAARIALVAASIDEARAIMVEGKSGLLAVAKLRDVTLKWEPSLNRVTWPNGTIATLFSGDNADGLRGPEHDFAWCDELAKWRQAENAWQAMQFGLRGGPRPRVLVTTTPRPLPLLEQLRRDPWTVETRGRTSDNLNLSKHFIEVMLATYGGTRVGRQEMEGEMMREAEGSLWPRDLIERCRVEPVSAHEGEAIFDRIVVGVDPPVSKDGDACGIVVAGRRAGKLYVLADASIKGASPERWARAVAGAAETWGASHIVAEANQGGEMVKSVLQAADAAMAVRLVHASRGKVARAEPVATRFEAGKAFFAGVFPKLEGELSGLCAGGNYDGPGRSPDRADAMVWALTELSDTRSGVPRVRAL